jgi:hypothetical protein
VKEPSVSSPFGINTSRLLSPFVVLDKSFLDGVSSTQLRYYARKGWTFGLTEALMHEHFRKRDHYRISNLFKLHSVEGSLFLLPGIGEMFRAETATLKPAPEVLKATKVNLVVMKGSSGEFFELDGAALLSTKERAADLNQRLPKLVEGWRMFSSMGELKDVRPGEMRAAVDKLSLQIRDDREDMRGFYRNHRNPSYPAPELIDERWALFRWIQVTLLAGLDFYASYGVDRSPNPEDLLHELLDMDYLVSALLVGGLACRETRFVERFRFLRPDGIVLK